ncbi:MAG: aspartyl/glutamyl-tRNA amidotransferase subunit C [Elusimicrobia bacterium]|nr:aspartyl/glutamyl-tRNA amidotransferase subunit C [Elusimicrobiota bacterium]
MNADFTAVAARRVAKLARLRLSDEEAARFETEFPRILELVAGLGGPEGAAAEAAPAAEAARPLREDEPAPFLEPERLLALAPERDGDFYKVMKVLE